jgi:hypothetical protein
MSPEKPKSPSGDRAGRRNQPLRPDRMTKSGRQPALTQDDLRRAEREAERQSKRADTGKPPKQE